MTDTLINTDGADNMESLKKIARTTPKFSKEIKPDSHLHSPAHVLADELSVKLNDKKHFGFYLKMALTYDHAVLRRIAGEVIESKTVRNKGKLFAFLIKKNNDSAKDKN